MKTTITIITTLLLAAVLIIGPVLYLVKLSQPNRYVTVQLAGQHGVVFINGKKIRVPYTMQQTAIPTKTNGIEQFLFLRGSYYDQDACFLSVLITAILGLLLSLLLNVSRPGSKWYAYRHRLFRIMFFTVALFVLSEYYSYYVCQWWVLDPANGLTGNGNVLNDSMGYVYPKYALHLPAMFALPLITLVVLIVNLKNKEQVE